MRLHLTPRHLAVWPVKFTQGRSHQEPLSPSTHRGCQAASCPFSQGRWAQPASHPPAPAVPPDWSLSSSGRVHIGATGKARSLDRGALIKGSSRSLSLPFPFFRERLRQRGSVEWDVPVCQTCPALPPPVPTCPYLPSPVPTCPYLPSPVLTCPHQPSLAPSFSSQRWTWLSIGECRTGPPHALL